MSTNSVTANILSRHSCRSYDPARLVDDKTITDLFEAVRFAPSACNRQPWTFYVVKDEEKRQRLLTKSRPQFIDAPVLIAAVGHHDQAWHRPADGKDHTDVDLSIAVDHLTLVAESMGLATCWICSFDVDAPREVLNLGQDEECIALIPLGYEKGEPTPKTPRKSVSEILKWV